MKKKIPTTISEEKALTSIKEITVANIENSAEFKKTFIVDQIKNLAPMWFEDYLKYKDSDDANERRMAFVEFAKLMGRVIPTQISAEEGTAVAVQVVGWSLNNPTFKKLSGYDRETNSESA